MKKILATILLLFVTFVFSKEWLTYTRSIHREFTQCFAVDSCDNIYVSHRDIIEVYNRGELLRTIDPHTNRDYFIYIENDELIVGYSSGKVKVYDLMGNYIRDESVVAQTLSKEVFKRGTKIFNGNTYCINKYFGCKPYEIMCNDKCIYKQAFLDYIYNGMPFHLSFCIGFVCALILILMIVFNNNCRIYKSFH